MSNRHRLLVRIAAVVAAAGFAAAPPWCVRAAVLAAPASRAQEPGGAAEDPVAAWRSRQFVEAVAVARAQGRPLLVLLVPERKDAWEAGHWFGALLRHGDDAFQFDVAACVLACAPIAEVQARLGAAAAAVAPSPCEVALLLVDLPASAKAAPTKVTRIEPALQFRPPTPPEPKSPYDPPAPQRGGDLAWQLDWRTQGVRTLSAAVHAAAQKHGVDPAAVATAVERGLTKAESEQAQAWLRDGGDLAPALLLRAAVALRQQAQALPAPRRTQALAELATALRATAAERPVAGAVWGNAYCPPCGMAAVSPLCERFLDFFRQPQQ